MRFPPEFRMRVTRRGEKEQRLSTFIAQSLAAVARGGKEPGRGGISAIARSAQSPVVRAIDGLSAEIAAVGYAVRILLGQFDQVAPAAGPAHPRAAHLHLEVRLARDPRLIEAHEQLVLGPRTCWTGDSMRRDPAACDAYESYIDNCAAAAEVATLAFERLWVGAEPLLEHRPMAVPTGPAAALERRP